MSEASSLAVPFDVLLYSVAIFIVIPLMIGGGLRLWFVRRHGLRWVEEVLLPRFAPVTIAALLLTLLFIFAFQAQNIMDKTIHVVLIAVPILFACLYECGAVLWADASVGCALWDCRAGRAHRQ